MNNKSVFRKSCLDRVSSPEQLNDYIKVSRPSLWLLLGAIIVLLIGVCVWGIFGTLTTSYKTLLLVQDGNTTCYISPEEAKRLSPGMEVRLGESIGKITLVDSVPMVITTDFNAYGLYISGLKVGDWIVPVRVDLSAQDGVYLGEIVLETISPISFVLN